MGTLKKFDNITKAQIASNGVQALADRPNSTGAYGVGGLSAADLKKWFDRLAELLAEKINKIQDTMSSDEAAKYIKVALEGEGIDSLAGLVDGFSSGSFAAKILKVYPSVSADELVTLQQAIYKLVTRAELEELVNDLEAVLEKSSEAVEKNKEIFEILEKRLNADDIGSEALKWHNENLKAHEAIFGEGNVRGLKGYWIDSVVPSKNMLLLSNLTDRTKVGAPTFPSGYRPLTDENYTQYEVGDEFSIITPRNHYNLCGKITNIQQRFITYELYTEIEWSAGDPLDNGDYSFCVPEKYDVGIVTISEGGLPTGFETVAGGDDSTSSGVRTNAHGAMSDSGGLRTKSGYCGFTRGSDNEADAKYSSIPGGIDNKVGVNGLQGFIGGGNDNEVNGYSGSARNGKNKVDADYGDGSGFGNTIEKGANASSVSGQYNTIKEGAHSVSASGYNNTVEGSGFAGLISGIVNWLKSKAGYVGGENCQSGEAWYQFLHGQGLRGGNKLAQALFGRFNKVNDNAVFQVGNGVLDEARSNAFEIISTRDDNGTNHVSMKLGGNEYSPSTLPNMVTGSYEGVSNNSEEILPVELSLGFTPKFLFIRGINTSRLQDSNYEDYSLSYWVEGAEHMVCANTLVERQGGAVVTITENGVSIAGTHKSMNDMYNRIYFKYHYVAIG